MEDSLNVAPSCVSLIKFALPTIAGSILSNIYSIVDGLFVSNILGTDALSAVNIILPFLTIVVAVSYMVGIGGSALIATQLGEGKKKEARENFSMLTVFCVGNCALFAFLGIIFHRQIIYFLGANDILYPLCEQYAVPLFLAIPFEAFTVIFQTFFVTEGKPFLGMCIAVLGGLSNIALDYLFLNKFALGIAGAALATGIGYAIPSVIGFYYFLFWRHGVLYYVYPVFRFEVLLHMASNGISEMVSMLSGSAVFIAINNLIIRLAGSDGIAAMTIILYMQSLLASLFSGYSMGVGPIISFRYGQQDYKSLKATHLSNIYIISVSAIVAIIVGLFFANPLVSIFVHGDSVVKEKAVNGLHIFTGAFLFLGYNMYASSFFTALNDARTSAILSFFRTLGFSLPLLFILSAFWGLTGIWIAEPLAEFLSFLMSVAYWIRKSNAYHYR